MYEDFQEELEVELDYSFTGMDYSPESVKFAQAICHKKYHDNSKFSFAQVDILQQNLFLTEHKFDILLDKGTLDAIALNQDPLSQFEGKIGMEVYASQVSQMMREGSILLITSCNFTEPELVRIVTEGTELEVWEGIKYPSFEFGGKKGSAICSIAFRRP